MLVFEISAKVVKVVLWRTDVDVFQALEKDPAVKRRLEEAASGELQMGWDREKKGDVVLDGTGQGVEEDKERREREVGEMLRSRAGEREGGDVDGGEINRMLSRGFGDVKTQ